MDKDQKHIAELFNKFENGLFKLIFMEAALSRIFHENFGESKNKPMIISDYNRITANCEGTKCHPSGELMSRHLLRVRPLAVGNHSFASCPFQLTQPQLVKYPG